MKVALSVAGSDSSGGAGIQVDVKAISSLGVHPCTVITCVTSQNTREVESIFPMPPKEVRRQLGSILGDIEVHAAKTGMLYSSEIASTVADVLDGTEFPLVVDPVLASTTKRSLEAGNLPDTLRSRILPRCQLVTPNIMEAEVLSGIQIREESDIEEACERMCKLGAESVLVKGGHFGDDPVDVMFSNGEFKRFTARRYGEDVHGSGCALSAFITANLALGHDLLESVEKSKKSTTAGFYNSYRIGKGVRVIHGHYSEDRYAVLKELEVGVEELRSILLADIVPEVGINVGYALPFATMPTDVAALKGRIVRVGDRIQVPHNMDFGASTHISRIILTAMRFDYGVRSAVNVRFSEDLVGRFKGRKFEITEFSRADEPKGVSTMEWGTEKAIASLGRVPDVIFDRGSIGKEPMVRILGRSPLDLVRKLRTVLGD